MASMTTAANGRLTVQFKRPDGKRTSVRLGEMAGDQAAIVRDHINHLADCWRRRRPPGPGTDAWLAELQQDSTKVWLYDRLAAAGLVMEREKPAPAPRQPKKPKATGKPAPETLGAFCDAYITSRTDLEQSTINNLSATWSSSSGRKNAWPA